VLSGFALADALARGGSLALLALWSWLLLRDHGHALAARLAVAMNAAVACHVLATIHNITGGIVVDWMFELGSVTVPALFWLFARAWFDDERRIGWLAWASVPLCMALVIVIELSLTHHLALAGACVVILRGAMFGLGFAGLWTAWRGRDEDLVEGRRRLRLLLIATVGLFVIATNVIEILAFNRIIADYWRSIIQIGIALSTLAFCAALFGIRQSDLMGAPRRQVRSQAPAGEVDSEFAVKIQQLMERDKPYRDERLTIASLAQRLGEQEYRLRRLINGTLGYRNFAQFLNAYRLAEVKTALADPAQREVPILTIALDAGFGSLGPFNRAFREAEGMTPSEFRSRAI
jgi:AraC-like DNA-binding protein